MLLVWGPHCGKAMVNEIRHPCLSGLCPPRPWGGDSLLISALFALLNEGNGFRSKAVGHFICAQGDPENILVVPVVILGDRNNQETDLKCQPRARRRADTLIPWNGIFLEKTVP